MAAFLYELIKVAVMLLFCECIWADYNLIKLIRDNKDNGESIFHGTTDIGIMGHELYNDVPILYCSIIMGLATFLLACIYIIM